MRASSSAFRPLTVALMIAVGLLSFAAMLVLGAYAPDTGAGRNGGAHALSKAAVGYNGLVRLAEATGRNPRVVRSEDGWTSDDLLVLTPETGAVDMTKVLAARRGKPTLVVLPKWATEPDRTRRGWVRSSGPVDAWSPQGVLAPATKLTVTRVRSGGRPLVSPVYAPDAMVFRAPRPLQTIRGDGLEPLVVDERGRVVLGRLPDGLYVLADPDLLANLGMTDLRQARAALAMLDFLNSNQPDGVGFDVTLNGLGRTKNPLQLAFEPPFLAMTLAVLAALLLAGWQALARFGRERTPERAIAFGKRALVDNTAALVRRAGRERALGGRYVDAIRERALLAFAAPPRLPPAEADAYLDRAGARGRFSELAARARAASHGHEVLAAARALHEWLGGKTK